MTLTAGCRNVNGQPMSNSIRQLELCVEQHPADWRAAYKVFRADGTEPEQARRAAQDLLPHFTEGALGSKCDALACSPDQETGIWQTLLEA